MHYVQDHDEPPEDGKDGDTEKERLITEYQERIRRLGPEDFRDLLSRFLSKGASLRSREEQLANDPAIVREEEEAFNLSSMNFDSLEQALRAEIVARGMQDEFDDVLSYRKDLDLGEESL